VRIFSINEISSETEKRIEKTKTTGRLANFGRDLRDKKGSRWKIPCCELNWKKKHACAQQEATRRETQLALKTCNDTGLPG
jgi:hypothetical protein